MVRGNGYIGCLTKSTSGDDDDAVVRHTVTGKKG